MKSFIQGEKKLISETFVGATHDLQKLISDMKVHLVANVQNYSGRTEHS